MVSISERARRERIRILLETRNDPYQALRARATPYTTAGPAPGRKRKCPACDGKGVTRLRRKCEICDGLQTIAVDSYTGRVADKDDRKPQPMSPERLDAEIRRLQTPINDPTESYGWEKAVESRNRQGSYRELEKALEWLRSHDETGWEFITWVYSSGLEVELSSWAKLREDGYIAKLSDHMPRGRVKIPKRLHTDLMDRKRKTVRQMLKLGISKPEIANVVLLSEKTIEKLA